MYSLRGFAGLNFLTSRGSGLNQNLQVGDTWTISITGAAPNSPVTVSGTKPGGVIPISQMGMTDQNGNWSRSGASAAPEVGIWVEHWAVNGQDVGTLVQTIYGAGETFVPSEPSVAGPGGADSPLLTQPAGSPAQQPPVLTPSLQLPMVAPGFDLSSIPLWGWAAAAGVALFAFGGGRGR